MVESLAEIPAIEPFLEQGYVTEVINPLKSGKEASAYLCRAGRRLGRALVVAKVYHDRERRNFANAAQYTEGRVILNGQARRAVAKKTEMGRTIETAFWVDHEFEVLSNLHYTGCDVPEVFVCTEQAILMEYIGGEEGPAPQLQHAPIAQDEVPVLRDRLLGDIEQYLANDVVHGDLSAFNVLYRPGRLTVIDFPQAVDPRFNAHARRLLTRDLSNLAKYFARHGHGFDAEEHAAGLWERWRHGSV